MKFVLMSLDIQELLKDLIAKRDAIEKEIKALNETLHSQKDVGMKESLVDKDQYPRDDIDVISVRHARHKILCLQNDHKSIMKEIEEHLHELHDEARMSDHKILTKLKHMEVDNANKGNLSQPFASVGKVEVGSPAEVAGLQTGDLLLQFGSLNGNNFNSLQDFARIVQHNRGVVVSRNFQPVRVSVKPTVWSGTGLLGCNVLPLKN